MHMAQTQPHPNNSVRLPPAVFVSPSAAAYKERLQSPVSSAGSWSSVLSYQKPYSPLQTQWPSPMSQHAHTHRQAPSPPQRTSPPRSQQSIPHSHPETIARSAPSVTYVHTQPEYDEEEGEHGIWILAYLSLLAPLHALTTSLITLLISTTLLLLSPFRLCVNTQAPLPDALIRALAPFHRQHLQMVYAPSVDNAFHFQFSSVRLVCVLLAAPLLSIGVMVAAWISGAFWVFATIMGNPDGTERRDDGQDAVLAVRAWWERWFLKALVSAAGDHEPGRSVV